MKTMVWSIALLLLTGLLALPAVAGELRVEGFIDTAISTDQNISGVDFNVTSNKDKATGASTRSQVFFNFIAMTCAASSPSSWTRAGARAPRVAPAPTRSPNRRTPLAGTSTTTTLS